MALGNTGGSRRPPHRPGYSQNHCRDRLRALPAPSPPARGSLGRTGRVHAGIFRSSLEVRCSRAPVLLWGNCARWWTRRHRRRQPATAWKCCCSMKAPRRSRRRAGRDRNRGEGRDPTAPGRRARRTADGCAGRLRPRALSARRSRPGPGRGERSAGTGRPAPPAPPGLSTETVASSSTGSSSGFLDRFHPYEPVYGAAELGDAGAKLQLSFDFRLLGHDDGPHLDFAYTQTMFWALGQPSGPFRATDYSPELFVGCPSMRRRRSVRAIVMFRTARVRRTSIDSFGSSLGRQSSFDLGGDWRFDITPQAWFYFGNRSSRPTLNVIGAIPRCASRSGSGTG